MFFKTKITDAHLYRASIFLIVYFAFVALEATILPAIGSLDYLGLTLWTAPLAAVVGIYFGVKGLKSTLKKDYIGRQFSPVSVFVSVLLISVTVSVVTGLQIVNYFNEQGYADQKLRQQAAGEAEQLKNNYSSYERVKADIDVCNIALVTWSRIYSFGNDSVSNRYLYIERREWVSGALDGSSNVWELPYKDLEQLHKDIDAMDASCDKKAEWRMPQHL
jgi:hypothetical protein